MKIHLFADASCQNYKRLLWDSFVPIFNSLFITIFFTYPKFLKGPFFRMTYSLRKTLKGCIFVEINQNNACIENVLSNE